MAAFDSLLNQLIFRWILQKNKAIQEENLSRKASRNVDFPLFDIEDRSDTSDFWQ